MERFGCMVRDGVLIGIIVLSMIWIWNFLFIVRGGIYCWYLMLERLFWVLFVLIFWWNLCLK